MKVLSRADFCAACGCVKSALSKAEQVGRVLATEDGRIPLTEGNMLFLEIVRRRKIEEMTLSGEVPKGWSVLAAQIGRRRQPMAIYPPFMLDNLDVIQVEGAPDFRFNANTGKITIDGQLYKAVLVYDRTPPVWLDREAREVLEGRRAPVGARARKAPGRRPAAAKGRA